MMDRARWRSRAHHQCAKTDFCIRSDGGDSLKGLWAVLGHIGDLEGAGKHALRSGFLSTCALCLVLQILRIYAHTEDMFTRLGT